MTVRGMVVVGLAGLLLGGCDGGSDDESDDGGSATDATDDGSSATASDTEGDTEGDTQGGGQCPDVIIDGSFEEGPLTLGWSTGSTNWETPICNATCYVGQNRAHDGDWWVWFGGMPVPESAFVSQMIPLAQGSAELVFRVEILAETPSVNDSFTVIVDDQSVFQISGLDEPEYDDYVEVRVDLSDFADGSIHLLSFDANFDGMSTTSFFLDSVEVRSCS